MIKHTMISRLDGQSLRRHLHEPVNANGTMPNSHGIGR
jgi:hypothetical protein